jgi:hypothetical protein
MSKQFGFNPNNNSSPAIIGTDSKLIITGFAGEKNSGYSLENPIITGWNIEQDYQSLEVTEFGYNKTFYKCPQSPLIKFNIHGYAPICKSVEIGFTKKRCIDEMSVLEILEYLNERMEVRKI